MISVNTCTGDKRQPNLIKQLQIHLNINKKFQISCYKNYENCLARFGLVFGREIWNTSFTSGLKFGYILYMYYDSTHTYTHVYWLNHSFWTYCMFITFIKKKNSNSFKTTNAPP